MSGFRCYNFSLIPCCVSSHFQFTVRFLFSQSSPAFSYLLHGCHYTLAFILISQCCFHCFFAIIFDVMLRSLVLRVCVPIQTLQKNYFQLHCDDSSKFPPFSLNIESLMSRVSNSYFPHSSLHQKSFSGHVYSFSYLDFTTFSYFVMQYHAQFVLSFFTRATDVSYSLSLFSHFSV